MSSTPLTVTLPARFDGTVDEPTWPYVVHLSLSFDGDRVQCEQITCQRRDGAAPVTSDGMTKIRVAELVHQVARRELGHEVAPPAPPAPPAGRAGPSLAHLRFVAQAYTIAYVCGGNPRREVMHELGLSRTTANRWIRMAREALLLHAGGDPELR